MANSNSNRYKMSLERLEELKKELVYMETVREKEVSEQIKEARSFGDLSENSEYDEAKTEQGKLYSRIAEYKDLIEHAEIVDNVDHNLLGRFARRQGPDRPPRRGKPEHSGSLGRDPSADCFG